MLFGRRCRAYPESILQAVRIPRLYIGAPLQLGENITLEVEAAHRLSRVLRLTAGAEVLLFDGRGGEHRGHLVSFGRNRAVVKVGEHREEDRESSLHTHLGLALSRGERMDWAVQKAVETGVHEITPLSSERSEVKILGRRQERHMNRWQQIIIHACEQSGRTALPLLHAPQEFTEWVAQVQSDCLLLLHQDASRSLPADRPGSCALLSGPEGGFSNQEIALAKDRGFYGWSLCPRTLRAETAPAAALTVLQYLWGDGCAQ